jgi:hypothetical protein
MGIVINGIWIKEKPKPENPKSEALQPTTAKLC